MLTRLRQVRRLRAAALRYAPAKSGQGVRSDRGGAEVELAILGPILLLVIFGAVQITTYFTARTVALSAAEVAVAAERRYDAPPGAGRDRAEQYLVQAGDWLVNAQVSDPVRTDEEVVVTVTGEAPSILVTFEIQQTARGTIERFTELP